MSYSKEIRELLEKHEGKRNIPYQDEKGNWTYGIGHNMREPIPDEVIYLQLEHDIQKAEGELDRVFPEWREMSEKRRIALVDFMFNVGAVTFMSFNKMRRALMLKDYETAAAELLDSRYAEQVGIRAERLADMLRNG